MKAVVAVLLILAVLPARSSGSIAAARHLTRSIVTASHPTLPLRFEANRGQFDRHVRYLIHGGGYTMFLTANEAVLALNAGVVNKSISRRTRGSGRQRLLQKTIRLQFAHANPHAVIVGTNPLVTRINYFMSNQQSRWLTDIPTYARVEYRNLYPHIDLVFYSRGLQPEYDWVIHPGARTDDVRLNVSGASGLRLDGRGNLDSGSDARAILQAAPRAYQMRAWQRRAVSVRYSIVRRNSFGFEIGSYDRSRTLVVDPVISYATYLGGKQAESGTSIAVDSQGEAYVAGDTISADFPVKNTLYALHGSRTGDSFVGKFSASGTSLLWMTYIGGSDYDNAHHIAIDKDGNAYVAGETASKDFPTLHAFQPNFGGGANDGWIAKLSSTGDALLFASYLGGNDNDAIYGLALDDAGNMYVAGNTKSQNFPTLKPIQSKLHGVTAALRPFVGGPGGNEPPPESAGSDAFVTRISPTFQITYSTFLGGDGVDSASGVAADPAGNMYVAGETQSQNFPTTPGSMYPAFTGSRDGFVTKIDASGQKFVYSSYVGGNDLSVPEALTVDRAGNAFITGQTSATDYIVKNAFQPTYGGGGKEFFYGDAFVTKLDPDGKVVYSTYLGGSADDEGRGITVGADGSVYVTGATESANFASRDGPQPAFIGLNCGNAYCTDAFVTKLDTSGQLSYSTFFGGSFTDTGNSVAVDSAGAAYVIGTTGSTDMQTIAAIRTVNDSTKEAANDAFVVKLAPGPAQVDHSISIGRVQILHKVKKRMIATTTLRPGESARFVVSYRDKNRGTRQDFGNLVVFRSGKAILQTLLAPGGSKGKPDLRTSVSFKGSGQMGPMVARIALIRGPATTIKSVKFTVAKH